MISQETIEQIKQAVEIETVVSASVKLRKVGKELVGLCPFHNEKTPSFSIDTKKGLYHCKGCSVGGDAIKFVMEHNRMGFQDAMRHIAGIYHIDVKDDGGPVEYVKPQLVGDLVLESSMVFFAARGISQQTVSDFRITESVQWMPKAKAEVPVLCFNYYRAGELVDVKFRAKNKDFKRPTGAELIFYNVDALKDENYCVIVEGEMDALAVHEAGFRQVVSVPNGATISDSGNLKYFDNCHGLFDGMTEIVLMTDNDMPGRKLRDELARRLGKDRCKYVDFPDGCKDANDVLLRHGDVGVLNMIRQAYPVPIEGILSMDDLFDEVEDFYQNGYPRGAHVGIPGLDDLISFMPGQMTVITGIPGSGKSEFTDNIMAHAAMSHGWKFGVCSFENQPSSLHVTKIMEKFAGKAFGHRTDASMRMNRPEFERAKAMVRNHFIFININQVEVTLDGILAKAKELVAQKGIHCLLIDPWNYIEHRIGKDHSETQYISECLSKIKAFCLMNDVHVFLIAHPKKMEKEGGRYPVPKLYDIAGSSHFYNKTDNGITVYRDYEKQIVEVHVQKVRYSWLGRVGRADFTYNLETRQYQPHGT